MRDRPSNTSSPSWKTTSQPQSHSTSQGTTSSVGDLGARTVASHRGTSVEISARDDKELQQNGRSLDEAAE